MAGGQRRVYFQIFKNFVESFTKRRAAGSEIGNDYLGNKYFETPADPSRGRRRPVRWFEPAIKEKFDQEVPVEWEAWLRYRRTSPPTEEEIARNLAIMEAKKFKAAQLEEAARLERQQRETGLTVPQDPAARAPFPRYEEYETPSGRKRVDSDESSR
ncbi:NADH dehydrogenase [ubiquinone] 1 alpha subcomplex assembly factor 2-like [Ornithodoros turicata]|uniref:NADH dehydrogenase [ubiquinone] 1 alpha subcomplex assembly factor 2-like n=1 Tax=Ornithodoros turicata TaxID=34597 RepID=UPI003138868A